MWALSLKPKDSFVWATVDNVLAATEREGVLLLRLLTVLHLHAPAQHALCGDGGALALKALVLLTTNSISRSITELSLKLFALKFT